MQYIEKRDINTYFEEISKDDLHYVAHNNRWKIKCECGKFITTIGSYNRHLETPRHKKLIKKQKLNA